GVGVEPIEARLGGVIQILTGGSEDAIASKLDPLDWLEADQKRNAERPWRHSHAGAWERSNRQSPVEAGLLAKASAQLA
ncbi:hypothetical protein, partial [Pseudomonas sp. NFACC17-2]|uniref:hypothetical protein n=1 Tax=Pseudomonas sp. NFACC17-2 TaxID=1566192 RepID=UPI001C483622